MVYPFQEELEHQSSEMNRGLCEDSHAQLIIHGEDSCNTVVIAVAR